MVVVVDLYVWSLNVTNALRDHYRQVLSPDETERMSRFVYERHRHHYIAARGRMREILAAEMSTTPDSLRFGYGPQGKPALPDGPSFNLSHSGGFACLAIHPTAKLGVDIEAFRTVEAGVAERFFSTTENEALAALPISDKEAGFFRCWTRKEALIKAIGGGLSIPLNAFDVTVKPEDPPQIARLDPGFGTAADWSLAHIDMGGNMVGAVAAQTFGAPLHLRIRSCPNDLSVKV